MGVKTKATGESKLNNSPESLRIVREFVTCKHRWLAVACLGFGELCEMYCNQELVAMLTL